MHLSVDLCTNAFYALKNAKDATALKAVSQNLMHSNLIITDGIYSILNENDVKKQIAQIGQYFSQENIKTAEFANLLQFLLEPVMHF